MTAITKILFLLLLGLWIPLFAAEKQQAPTEKLNPGSTIRVMLLDGTEVRGALVSEDSLNVVVKSRAGVESIIPRSSIKWIELDAAKETGSRFHTFDPNYSRLILMPTGRPLRSRAGYFSDTWLFFPSVSYGITDNITAMAGMTVFPFADITDQIMFFSPKVGVQLTDKLAAAVGVLYITLPHEITDASFGIGYVVATYGGEDSHITAGLGWGYLKEKDRDLEIGNTPATLVGGYLRTSESSAIMFETWYVPSDEYEIQNQPFGFAFRLFNSRIAVDAGVFATLRVISEGETIVPWLSFAYNFGMLR